jgi:hypothetical protein
MCRVLKVKRSGFYAWQSRPKSKRQEQNEKLLVKIKEIHEKKHRIYGYKRITKALPEDMKVSEGRVYRIMKRNGINPRLQENTDHRPQIQIIICRLLKTFSIEISMLKNLARNGFRILRTFQQKKVSCILPEFLIYMTEV